MSLKYEPSSEPGRITTLPPELGHISSLTELLLDGNPLRPPLADAFEEEGMEGEKN